MRSFSKRFIGLLAIFSNVCTHFCSDFNLSRVVIFTPASIKSILYSQQSSLFNGNSDFKLHIVQMLGSRFRYVSCEDSSININVRGVRAISKSKYSLRNGHEAKWFVLSRMTMEVIKRQSWFTTWWNSFNNTFHSCGVDINSAGPYVDTSHGTFLEGIAKIKEFYIALKETSISSAEAQNQIVIEFSWLRNYILETGEALVIYQKSISIPNKYKIESFVPNGHFYKAYYNLFTEENASIFLEDWKISPLNILCVSSQESLQIEFLNAIHELIKLIPLPSLTPSRNVEDTGCHFSSKLMFNYLCPGTINTESSAPIITINLGMASPETLVAGHILANNFNSFADRIMTYDSSWTIRGGCVLLIVAINNIRSPATLNGTSRKDALLAAVSSVRLGCGQQSTLETNLASGGSWELSRTTGPWDMSFEDPTHFEHPIQIISNIISWLSEVFEGEYSFEELKNMNAAILADSTGETLTSFCEKIKTNILFSLGVNNSRAFLFNFVPTGI